MNKRVQILGGGSMLTAAITATLSQSGYVVFSGGDFKHTSKRECDTTTPERKANSPRPKTKKEKRLKKKRGW